ncbi:MAG: helix-turn-helix domain-containing protein [Parachlamydiaceae bacterium]|nr:helix-turn-helix domain-containing protein [Parachlamydiaceae bacterium]
MLTVKQVSEKMGIGVSTVNLYCRTGRFPNAKKEESPIGQFWLIPETDLTLVRKRERGRPKTKINKGTI